MTLDKDEKRITVKIDPKTHTAAKVKAAQEGTTLSDRVRELLDSWLKGEDKPKK